MPPSSNPTYPGGAPISLETACFSMNSDMSIRIRLSLSSKRCAARALARAVFPTPVGPAKRNAPMGRDLSCKPVLARQRAADSVFTASSCPTTCCFSTLPSVSSFCRCASVIFSVGIPVRTDTMAATSSSSTSAISVVSFSASHRIRAREHASSNKSIALSGRNRSCR